MLSLNYQHLVDILKAAKTQFNFFRGFLLHIISLWQDSTRRNVLDFNFVGHK